MISPAELDDLMSRGWPALGETDVDGWVVRRSGGITQRANSVLPRHSPRDMGTALTQVEALYAEHGLPCTFQLGPAAQPTDLDAILGRRGYEFRSLTLVLVASVTTVVSRVANVDIRARLNQLPDEEWLRLWWAVDGRGDLAARAIAGQILTACPAVYASIYDSAGIAAVGRLALVERWGGVYCMTVRPDARRRGHATGVLAALAREARVRGIDGLWLQVVEANSAARSLYRHAGFVDASTYHYRVRP